MIQPGQLDRSITIQSKTVEVDDGGSATETWTDEAVVWAAKADQGGREFRAAGTVMAEATTLWTIRYRRDLTAANRIKYGSRLYDIVAPPSEIGRRGWLLIQSKYVGDIEVTTAIKTFAGEDLETFIGEAIEPIQT